MSLRSVQAVSWAANFSVLVMLLRSHTESLSQVCSSQISRGKRAFSRYGKSNFVRNKPPVQLTVELLLITIFHLCLLSLMVTGFGSSPLAQSLRSYAHSCRLLAV